MTRITRRLIGVAALTMCVAVPHAGGTRDCTDDEKHLADQQLMAIAQDRKWSERLIKQHLPFGAHIGRHSSQGGPTNEKLLVQAGYVMLHDGDLRTALWAAHKLTSDDVIQGKAMDRVECFRPDKRLSAEHAAINEDYEEPIFDRGHIAPDRDLRDDLTDQLNSYVLSNIAPKYDRFNSGIWSELEKLGRDWAEAHETVYVTSGALFDFEYRDNRDEDEKAARMGSRHQTARVAIASDFYKVFMRRCGNQWCSIAFVLEHHNGPGGGDITRRLQKAIKPLACIEGPAEITFYPELDRAEIRESLDGSGWGLASGNASNGSRKSSCTND